MRLAYITAHAPYGRVESFVLQEILALKKRGHKLLVVPRNPPNFVLHEEYFREISPSTVRAPLFSIGILIQNIRWFLRNPFRYFKSIALLTHSRSTSVLAKNLLVFPKGVWLASLLQKGQIEHLHAHWGSTPSTMALVASKFSRVPWSFTIHRYGLWEKNLLREKVENSAFTRVISRKSRRELLEIVGQDLANKIKVIHVGFEIPANFSPKFGQTPKITLATPANFVEVKGHIYLVRAAEELVKSGITNWKAILWGDGPLKEPIQREIDRLHLQEFFELPGAVPHTEVIRAYTEGRVQAVVLPSIVTENGLFEGIPTALVEALAYRIPVVATNTGSISELLEDGAGILVPQKSPEALQEALARLIQDEALRSQLAEAGFKKVQNEFNLEKISEELEQLFLRNKKLAAQAGR